MRKLVRLLMVGTMLLGASLASNAFSLLGPITPWQTPELNYTSPFTSIAREGDLGGPMNLGEEYRWSGPVVVYGFDSSFVEYFGQTGVAAVEAAITILNNLPAVPAMTPTLEEFPLNATRYNYVAQQLRLRDVKSIALSILLEQLGLACPERYTWTLRQRNPIDGTTPQQYFYGVIQRNFDPITWRPSSYVNNTLYTYQIVEPRDDLADCQELAVDVANPNVSVVASAGLQAGVTDPRVKQQVYGPLSSVVEGFGLFYTGLTRDDAGAIRYMYRSGNTNWQSAPLGSTGGSSGGGGSAGSPWDVYGFQVINPTPGSPWAVVGDGFFSLTNGAGGGTVIPGTTVPNSGVGGWGKVAFVRVDTDPLLGAYLNPVIVRYTQNVINSSGVVVPQVVSRAIVVPDILFSAADVGDYPNNPQPYVYGINGTTYTQAAPPTGQGTEPQAGPGIVEPGIEVVYNKVGPWLFHVTDTSQQNGVTGFVWGSYDGSTNAPVVYPVGATLQELESTLYGQQ